MKRDDELVFIQMQRCDTFILAADIYKVAYPYDTGFVLSHTVSTLLCKNVEFKLLTSSRTLFELSFFLNDREEAADRNLRSQTSLPVG